MQEHPVDLEAYMGLCEAQTNVKVGDFVHGKLSLKLIHVDSIKEDVQKDGLCDGVQGLAISGHDAAGNWVRLQPCDWTLVSDPAAFIQHHTLIAQAQFIVDVRVVWPELAEQLAPWVERTLKWYAKDDYEKQLQEKRVGYWREDYQKNKRRGFTNTL